MDASETRPYLKEASVVGEFANRKLRQTEAASRIAFSRGALAQLVRALPCHGRGCGFEPRRLRGIFLTELAALTRRYVGVTGEYLDFMQVLAAVVR